MIASPGPGAPNPAAVTDGIMYSYRHGAGSTLIGQTPVNNRNSKSTAYRQMNNLVISLDATYATLSPSQQAAWEAAAAGYPPHYLCGCSERLLTGQKLARSTNWLPAIAGQPYISAPITPIHTPAIRCGSVVYVPSGVPGASVVNINMDDLYGQYQLSFGLKMGVGNPTIIQPLTTPVTVVTESDPAFQYLSQPGSRTTIPYCGWSLAGDPWGQGTALWQTA